jgi:hypothetical protein
MILMELHVEGAALRPKLVYGEIRVIDADRTVEAIP